jgi:uncharacterized protein (DUF1330 family)
MTVYTIAHLKFTDVEAYRRYQAAFPAVFAKFNGKVVVADEAPVVTNGTVDADKVVVLSFPDAAEAKRFFESAEYREIAKDRDAGARLSAVLVKGFETK